MLTLQQLRGDKELAIKKLAKKGVDAAPVIAKIEDYFNQTGNCKEDIIKAQINKPADNTPFAAQPVYVTNSADFDFNT